MEKVVESLEKAANIRQYLGSMTKETKRSSEFFIDEMDTFMGSFCERSESVEMCSD